MILHQERYSDIRRAIENQKAIVRLVTPMAETLTTINLEGGPLTGQGLLIFSHTPPRASCLRVGFEETVL